MTTESLENEKTLLHCRIKSYLIFFTLALIFSGLTAFPIESELVLAKYFVDGLTPCTPLAYWIALVHDGTAETNLKFPFIAYGTDWLAFAHLVLALLFIGPIRDPVKNIWVVQFGMLACVAVIPHAMIADTSGAFPVIGDASTACSALSVV
jgi:hypothetical protein